MVKQRSQILGCIQNSAAAGLQLDGSSTLSGFSDRVLQTVQGLLSQYLLYEL